MPRHTHPKPKNKHSRAHTRHQRERYHARRWQQSKERYGDGCWLYLSPATDKASDIKTAQRILWQNGPNYFLHPELYLRLPKSLQDKAFAWPFHRPMDENPWTKCSCWICQGNEGSYRVNDKRLWQQEVAVEILNEEE